MVDDVVPADVRSTPRACRPNGPLWPSIIEKAFAKVCGGYEKMDFVARKKLTKAKIYENMIFDDFRGSQRLLNR